MQNEAANTTNKYEELSLHLAQKYAPPLKDK